MLSIVLALMGFKCCPYFQVPYLVTSVLTLSASLTLTINSIRALSDAKISFSWTPILLLVFSNGLFLFQVYFLYIKFICYRILIRKRKVCSFDFCRIQLSFQTVTTSEKGIKANNMIDDTYSTRSTVIVSDDYLPAPPT